MLRRRGKSNKLLLYLLNKKLNIRPNSGNRPLYIALVFAAFFALIIILQIFSVEKSTNDLNYNVENEGILGRFRLFSKKNDEKEVIFEPKVAQELERILEESKYRVDSFGSVVEVITESNQSIANDVNDVNDVNDFYSQLTQTDHWQEVSDSRHKFYVFSAYYDDRNLPNRYIRIIGATKTRTEEKVYCKLWFAHTYPPLTVNAINKVIRENWNLKYSAYFILCPIFSDLPVPDAVSLFIRDTNDINERTLLPSNRLLIHNTRNSRRMTQMSDGLIDNTSIDKKIAVCVKPLHYNYNKALNLIEFIELNRILGVTHFLLYNHTVGPDVDCLLRKYIHSGIVTMLAWNLNMQSQKEIRTEGLFAALNDCLYRTMNRFKYVLMIDIDELIIPYKHNGLLAMLNSIDIANGHRIGAYSFQNAFFYSQWPDDQSVSKTRDYPLTTLLKTRRKSQLHIHKQRSKCIVRPESVVEMGNHFVWEFLPTKLMVNVNPKIAILHHYRVCEFGGDDCIKTTSVVDRRIYYWKEELIHSVKNTINKWSQSCNLDDLLLNDH